MSHNVEVTGVEFSDLAVLKAATAELLQEANQSGEFVQGDNAYIRGYMGRREKVDAAILLPGQPYDIGFRMKDGVYTPYYEYGFSARGLCTEYDAKTLDKNNVVDSHAQGIGKLTQRYSVIMAEKNARRLGLSSRRVSDRTNGQIRLEIQ